MSTRLHPTAEHASRDQDRVLPPGSTIGILGGGQLGRMLSLAAARLGLKTHIYCARKSDSPAFHVSAHHTIADFEDTAALKAFAAAVDIVTFEFENVPAKTLEVLAPLVPVAPGKRALELTQDRLTEKTFLSDLQLPVAPFAAIETPADLQNFTEQHGKSVLKTRRFGYDGKGQSVVHDPGQATSAFQDLGNGAVPLIAEAFIDYQREVSALCVRGSDNRIRFYDICENRHADGILRETHIPAALSPNEAAAAREIAENIAAALDYIGVLTVEMFAVKTAAGQRLLVNEIAPRVHNSGHWTLDACHISQFENHIRAIAGWPLGSTSRHSDCVMTNLIGEESEAWRTLAAEPGAALHLYGKSDVAKGRKMGHVTRLKPPKKA